MLKSPVLLFLIFLIYSNTVLAQNKYSADSVEITSSKLFESENWNKLISYGESAVKKGVESYSLYLRLGMAYYETKKYFKAIPNLEKAVDLSYNNPSILKYLYYSYNYAGRTVDKNYFFNDLSESVKRKVKPFENDFMDNIHVEAGKIFTNDFDKNSSNTPAVNPGGYAEQILNGDGFYFTAGFKQIPLRWINISYDYSYLKLSKKKEIQFSNQKVSDSYSQYQNRFYNKYDFLIANGFIVSPAGHYVSVKDNTIYATSDSNSYLISKSEKFSDDFVVSVEIAKYFSVFKFSIDGSFSYLNSSHQSQYGLNLKWNPSGNINFYTNTSLTLHDQNKISNLIFTEFLSGKIHKNLWGSAIASVGNMNNYNEQNGFMIYNDPDIIKYKFGAELKYYFPHNLSANLNYEYQNRKKNYGVNYNSNSISAGINFGF